jgi:hypothetical protein
MSDYSELKRLAEAATQGPWSYDGSYVCTARVEDGTTYVETWRSVADCVQPENTKFIAAANPAAVRALIAENERLSALLECSQGVCRQAIKIVEKLAPEADLYQQVQIAAGSLPSGWEIALRVENGCGSVDLIDPYGTVVDLDTADESLGESIASAVAFAMSKEG